VAGEIDIRPLPPLRSRALVREAMLMAGAAVARFALAHDLPLPYTSQEPPLVDVPPASTPAEMFARRRLMRPGQQSTIPGRHAGLGLDGYAQATSPLRRYLDLVVHQQLRAFVAGRPQLDVPAILERIGAADAVVGSVRWAERRAIQHWTLVYLLRRPSWEGDAVLVEQQGAYDRYLIPALALETELYRRQELPLDSVVRLAFQEANLPQLQARFHRIG
jgi:exoribonuclease-2